MALEDLHAHLVPATYWDLEVDQLVALSLVALLLGSLAGLECFLVDLLMLLSLACLQDRRLFFYVFEKEELQQLKI